MIGIICFLSNNRMKIIDWQDFINQLRTSVVNDLFPQQIIADFLMLGDPKQPNADVPHILQLYSNIKLIVLSDSFDEIINNNDDTIHPIINLINQTNCQQNFDSNYIQSLQDMHFFYSNMDFNNALRNQNLLIQKMREVIG